MVGYVYVPPPPFFFFFGFLDSGSVCEVHDFIRMLTCVDCFSHISLTQVEIAKEDEGGCAAVYAYREGTGGDEFWVCLCQYVMACGCRVLVYIFVLFLVCPAGRNGECTLYIVLPAGTCRMERKNWVTFGAETRWCFNSKQHTHCWYLMLTAISLHQTRTRAINGFQKQMPLFTYRGKQNSLI